MAYVDDVIAKNKKSLTRAQIAALQKASEEYNRQNAGNRAAALANAREQYDAGYRGLQNMGLAGAYGGQATSGEVPRLDRGIRTPVDMYLSKVKSVENQRLNALGTAFAQQTQRERAEAEKKKAEQAKLEEEAARQRMEAAAEVYGVGWDIPRSQMALVGPDGETATPTPKQVYMAAQGQNVPYFNALMAATEMMGISQEEMLQGYLKENAADEQRTWESVQPRITGGKVVPDIDVEEARQSAQRAKEFAENPNLYVMRSMAQDELRDADKRLFDLQSAEGWNVSTQQIREAQERVKRAQDWVEHPDHMVAYNIAATELDDANTELARLQKSGASEEQLAAAQGRVAAAEYWRDHPEYVNATLTFYSETATPQQKAQAAQVLAEGSADMLAKTLHLPKPSMSRGEYDTVAKNYKQYKTFAESIIQYRNELAQVEATGAYGTKEHEKLDELAGLLMEQFGLTPDEVIDLVDRFEQSQSGFSQYEPYRQAYLADYLHQGEAPSGDPPKGALADKTYCAVNNISSPGMVAANALAYNPDADIGQYITDEQRNAYNAIYEREGRKAANEYLQTIMPLINLERGRQNKEWLEKMAREYKVGAWAISVGANLVGSIPSMGEKLVTSARNMITRAATGGTAVPVRYDPHSSTSEMGSWANTIRSEQSRQILRYYDEKGQQTWGRIVNFGYNGVSNGADSMVAMAITGLTGGPALANVLFFSSAGNAAYDEAIERGATQDQAMTMAVISGSLEVICEDISLETAMKRFETDGATWTGWLMNSLIHKGVEASEELNTELGNILAELMVLSDKSELMEIYNTEGKDAAISYILSRLGEASLGGAFGTFGADIISIGTTMYGVSKGKHNTRQIGQSIRKVGDVQAATQTATMLGGDAMTAAASVQQRETDTSVGRMYEAAREQAQALDVTDTDTQVAVQRIIDGKVMDNVEEAGTVLDALGKQRVETMGYDASSPEAFQRTYNDRVQKNGFKSLAETAVERQLETEKKRAANRVWANPEQGLTLTSEDGRTVTGPDGQPIKPMPGNMTAVSMAEQQRTGFQTRTTAKVGNATYAISGMQAREGLTNDQTYKEIFKGLTKKAQEKARTYERLADALGVKMVIHDVMTFTNGFIDEKGNMHVVLSGRQSIPRVVAHELTHQFKQMANVEYSALRDHLIKEIGDEKFDALVKKKAKQYGLDLSTEKGRIVADDEACAELCERMLSSEDAITRFAEKDTNAAKKLKEHLLKIINAIKDAFKRAENRNFGDSESALIQSQETIDAWYTALDAATRAAEERLNTTEGQIADVAGVTTVDQQEMIADVQDAQEKVLKKQRRRARTRQSTVVKETEQTAEKPAEKEKAAEKEKTAAPAKPKSKPRRFISVTATEGRSQGTAFEGGRAPKGMANLAYKIERATKFGTSLQTGRAADYATFGGSSYFGNLDGDAYGYSKNTWRTDASGRAILDSQAAVSSASDLKTGDAFVDDVLRMDFLTADELGRASKLTESEITDRGPVDIADVLDDDQIQAASTIAEMLGEGSEIVVQLPVSGNFDQMSRATLAAIFRAIPEAKRTGISFATGLTSNDIAAHGDGVSLIITDKSQAVTNGKRYVDLTVDSVNRAEVDAAVGDAIAEHCVDVIKYDMEGYKQDLMDTLNKEGIMSETEIKDLFSTMEEAVSKIEEFRSILDFGPEAKTEEEVRAAKEGREYKPYKPNADPHYKLALDFSTLCRKRLVLQMIQERLQAKLKRSLSPMEIIAIRRELKKLQKEGVRVEVACGLCYVEAARLKSPKVIDEFIGVGLSKEEAGKHVTEEMKNYFAQKDKDIKSKVAYDQEKWKEQVLGKDWTGTNKSGKLVRAGKATKAMLKAFGGQALVDKFNQDSKIMRVEASVNADQQRTISKAVELVQDHPEDFLSERSLRKMKREYPDIYYAFINKVRSATRSKTQEGDTFYARGDISMVDEATMRYANEESGVRHQSWSDFMTIHMLDTMAAVIEMSSFRHKDGSIGNKMHAYTKVPEMVMLLGDTGMMLNLSLIPSGETGIVNGMLSFDPVEGMDYQVMLKLRRMFPNTVGNIAIGISDEQIRMLLNSDEIDYVIPYHASGLNKALRTQMGIHAWLDYTKSQEERVREGNAPTGRTWENEHKAKKMKPPALKAWFNEEQAKAAGANGIDYMRKAAQEYLDICARDGWVPKFSQYLEENDGRYTPKPGYENYWKMLIDRKMVNQITGEVIIQKPVVPKFNRDTVMSILNNEVKDPTSIWNAETADVVANELAKTWRADRDNSTVQDKAAYDQYRETTAMMAAENSADRILKNVELRKENIRYDLDTELIEEVNKAAENDVRRTNALFSLDVPSKKGTRAEKPAKEKEVYKPAGKEPRVRDVNVPERAKTGERVSDFVRSFFESDKASDEIVENLMDKVKSGEWGSYTVLTNEDAMNRAKDYIAKKQFTEAQQDFHGLVASGRYNVHTRALGLQLLTEAANRGDTASVLDIATDLRTIATDAGQSLQIMSVLKELGGVGSGWYMQKEIDRLNLKYADEIASGKMKEITVDKGLMQDLIQATTKEEIEAAEDAIAEQIADQLPLTWRSRITNWRYLSMLGNPTTHFRNITGNVFMAGLVQAKDVVAVGVQRAAEKTGISKEADRAHAVLTKKDRAMWKDVASKSFDEQEKALRGSGKNGFASFIQQHMRSFDNRVLNAIAQGSKTGKNVLTKNGVMGMLEVEDVWFLRPAYQNAFAQYMKAQGFTVRDGIVGKARNGAFTKITVAEMNNAVDWASQQAWKATFRDASTVASILNEASKKLGPVGNILIEGVMPFKKTPINIAKRGIEYSPVGVIMGTVQLLKNVKSGKMTAAQAIDNIASGIVGTSLMAVGMIMAKAGILHAGDDDDKKKGNYLLDTGDQTYALKFGNVSIGISALAPAAIPLLMGAALYDKVSNGDDFDPSAIVETVSGTLDPFMEMSVVSSLNSALKNYNTSGIGGALGSTIMTTLESYGAQFLPTFTGKVGQFIDPTVRTTKSSAASPLGTGLDYYARSLMKKVPGLEATLQPDVNVWGRTTKKGNPFTLDGFTAWGLDFANKFLLPVNVKVANRGDVDIELIRLLDSTGDVSILPSDGPKYFTVNGIKYPMTAAQYTEYSIDRGNASYAAIKEIMASSMYQNASDEEKVNMISRVLEAAQKQVNTIWKGRLGALSEDKAEPSAESPKPTDIKGDYSDPALYNVVARYPNEYDRAAKAKAAGVSPETYLSLYEKKDTYIGDERATYVRQEIMNSDLTPEQKLLMDDLIVSDKGYNPDYTSPVWFEISMIGKKQYEAAKEGESIGIEPYVYLAAYKKHKEVDSAKLGKEKKPTVIKYLDSLNLTKDEYDFMLGVFGY